MRTRRWLTIVIFAVCALAVVEGLGWVTYQALRLEKREQAARAEAQFQERIRHALWTMENVLGPVLAQEASRPYFHYSAFYPAERAYARMWQPVQPHEVLVPSPLLETSGQFVRLHFQIAPDGTISSPQAPTGELRTLAESAYVDGEFLLYADGLLARLGRLLQGQRLAAPADVVRTAPEELGSAAFPPAVQGEQHGYHAAQEFYRRQEAQKIAQSLNTFNRGRQQRSEGAVEGSDDLDLTLLKAGVALQGVGPPEPHPDVRQGSFDAVWITGDGREPELFLRRSVWIQGQETVQGVWLDWQALKERLLGLVSDQLPQATLEPAAGPAPAADPSQAFMLAGIPALLTPGPVPPPSTDGLTPIHSTLIVTWIAVLAAVGAIGLVLRASMDLSDRRGRFVSAVTHELRTPLTTFRLYTEMLADGMVQDEDGRREYLRILKDESKRLARIVENVLAYARLSEGRPKTRPAPIPAAELLEQVFPALRRRAEQSGMELVTKTSGLDESVVRADSATVERILLNLVDNACKYAGEAADRRLHLSARSDGAVALIEFSDHGPGIPRSETARIFNPFHRLRRDSDGPKAGLGLGLALARGLAVELGGDLELVRTRREGAHFRLKLPIVGRPLERSAGGRRMPI